MPQLVHGQEDRLPLVVLGRAQTEHGLVDGLAAIAGVAEDTPPGLKRVLSCSRSVSSKSNDRILKHGRSYPVYGKRAEGHKMELHVSVHALESRRGRTLRHFPSIEPSIRERPEHLRWRFEERPKLSSSLHLDSEPVSVLPKRE